MVNQRLSLFRLAYKGVVRKLFRNAILLLAVFLLVALLVFALLFNHAVQEDLEGVSRKLGADMVMVPVEAMDTAEEFILESKEKTFYMDASVFDSVRKMDDVAAATFQVYLSTLASGCCSILDAQVVAIDQQSDFIVRSWMDDPAPLGKGQVYVGSYVYEYLGLISTPSLFGHKVQVIDHLEPTGTGLDHAIFMRQEDLRMVAEGARGQYQPGKISIIFLKIKAGRDLEEVVNRIQSAHPAIGILTRGTIGGGIRDILADIMRIFKVTIFCSGTLAILLVWSAFTALTNERRREVGILRAIGARRRHIIAMYLGEAAIIGGMGSLLGVGGGIVLLEQLGHQFQLLSRVADMDLLTLSSLQYCALGWLSGVMVCLVGAWLPVLRLANLEPLDAIKVDI